MATDLDEVNEFLVIAANKGFLNENTVNARRTACNKFFDILDADQKNVEYVSAHLDVIKSRFANLNKDVAGTTVDEYARRVQLVINDFTAWKDDRSGWERTVSARQSARPASDSEKKAKPKADKPKGKQSQIREAAGVVAADHAAKPETRTVTFPIRPDFDLSVTLPRAGLKVDELKKLVYFLLPYTQDWEPTESPKTVFAMLERDSK